MTIAQSQTVKKTISLDNPYFEGFISLLIIYSVICFSIETLPDLSANIVDFLSYSEVFVVLIFTGEYLFRIWNAENKLKFIFSFYGLIDLMAILPFYVAPMLDLETLRLVRLLRLTRLFKLTRYNRALTRFSVAINESKEELIIFILASIVMLYMAAVGIYHFEHEAQPEVFRSIFDCLWWAMSTLTTVGYGDIYPITLGGRLFTFAVLMLGLGLVAVPTGIVASSLSTLKRQENI